MLATLNAQHQKIQNLEARLTRLSTLSPPKPCPQRDLSENGAISKALQDIVARIDLLGAQLQGIPSPTDLSRGGALHGPRSAAKQRRRSASDHLHVHYWAGLPRAHPPLEPCRRTLMHPLLPAAGRSAAVGISGCGPLPAVPCQEPIAPKRNDASAHTPMSAVPFVTRAPVPGSAAGTCNCVASGTLTITPRAGEAVGCGMRSPAAPAMTTADTSAENTAAWRMVPRSADERVFEELGRMAPQPRDLAVAYVCPGTSDCAPSHDVAVACVRPQPPTQISSTGPPTASRGNSPRLAHTAGTNSAPLMGGRRGPTVAARIPRDAPPMYERWLPEASAALHWPTAGLSPPASVGPCFAEVEEPVVRAAVSQRGSVGLTSLASVGPCYSEAADRDEAIAWAVWNAQQAAAGQPAPPSMSTELYSAEAADVDDAIAWAK